MKLKLTSSRNLRHLDTVCAIDWSDQEKVLSIGDDHQFLETNTSTNETKRVCILGEAIYPTSMHMLPRSQTKLNGSDIFAMTTSNGKLLIMSKSTGKIEKNVDAHRGAALAVRWNSDGTGLLTAGEDGAVKMWSRNGMLRSVLAQLPSPIYCVSWNENSSSILYCNADYCYIKSLKMQTAALKWKAHDGIVLCCDWSPTSSLIVTGGEDCKFKLWNNYGQILFNSLVHDYPITSVRWCVDGSLFSIGSHNILRLCDKSGWSHSLEKMNKGSIMAMTWSPDGTQLAFGTSSGHVYYSHIIEKRATYKNFEIVQTQKSVIEVRDVNSEIAKETLETKERISRLSIKYQYLIVITTSNIYIYSSSNWNTPTIVQLDEKTVNVIIQCEKSFLISDGISIIVYNYEGRKLCTLSPPGQPISLVDSRSIGLSVDTVVIRDRSDAKLMHLFDPNTGKQFSDSKIKHEYEIVELAINQCGPINERIIAFRDSMMANYIAIVKTFGITQKISKIGSLIEQLMFNDVSNMLCGITEGRIVIWPLPNIVNLDRSLLQKSVMSKNIGNVGKFPQIISYSENTIVLRKSDGSLFPIGFAPFCAKVIEMASNSKWDQAIRLCRSVNDETVWTILAGVSLVHKNLFASEMAYSALNEVEKVSMINECKEKADKDIRQSMQILLTGKIGEAENYLERSGHPFRAIMINIQMFYWKRALEIAIKHRNYLEVVLGFRAQYLKDMKRTETDENFLKYMSQVEIDWIHIREIIDDERAKGNY